MFGSALGTVYDVSSWPCTNVSNTWDVRDSVHLSAARWAYGLPGQAAPVPAQKQYDELQTRAQQLADAKNFQSAAAIYEQLLRATPNSPQVLNNLGAAYAHLENYTQAQKAYERALRVEPHSFPVLLNLGLAYFKSGNAQGAIKPLAEAVEQKPDDFLSLT
jgi:tetratricopeptide (TPR) repeat protein